MTILDSTLGFGNLTPPTFGLGLIPPASIEPDPFRDDARIFFHPASASDIDEETARSIAQASAAADEWARLDEAYLEFLRLEELERLADCFGQGRYTDFDRMNSAAL